MIDKGWETTVYFECNLLLPSIIFMSNQCIRIMVVDDHEIVRKSILTILAREPDMEVVGTAVNGREAIQLAQSTQPDVIIMDVSMPELDGIRAAGEIKAAGNPAQIVLLSMHHNSTLVQQARKSGVTGYIIKQQATRELLPAIRAAYAGTLSL